MKDIKKIVWGAVLLAVGVILVLNAFNVTDIDILFPGWWTVFIIVPCLIGLFTERDKTGNLIGLGIGVMLLLSSLDVIDFSYVWKVGVPVALILIALKLIVEGSGNKSERKKTVVIEGDIPVGTAIFSGSEMNFDGQIFDGANLTAVFGGVDCDLSRAIIERDCEINVTAIFGGVEIILPDGVNLKIGVTSVFGGTADEYTRRLESGVTIHVKGFCMFGGVDIK